MEKTIGTTINYQVNLTFIRKNVVTLEYKESNGIFFTQIPSGIIYFQDRKIMEDFQNCLKDPSIHFYSHPKVTVS